MREEGFGVGACLRDPSLRWICNVAHLCYRKNYAERTRRAT